jgi:hypothetical protein
MFGIVRPKLNLFPLNLYLKNKKINFSNFIKLLINDAFSPTSIHNPNALLPTTIIYID